MSCGCFQLDGCQQAQIQYRQNLTRGSPIAISTNLPTAVYITVGVDTITLSDKARNIGVTYDTHLTLSYHVNDVVKKAFYHLKNIAKISKYISAETTEILIHCFITSKLDFCIALLDGLPKYQINKLQNVQNTAARIIARLRKYDHIKTLARPLKTCTGCQLSKELFLKLT